MKEFARALQADKAAGDEARAAAAARHAEEAAATAERRLLTARLILGSGGSLSALGRPRMRATAERLAGGGVGSSSTLYETGVALVHDDGERDLKEVLTKCIGDDGVFALVTDGTSRFGSHFQGTLATVLDDQWDRMMMLMDMLKTNGSTNHTVVIRSLDRSLALVGRWLDLQPEETRRMCVSLAGDSGAENGKAYRTLLATGLYSGMLYAGCLSHVCNNAGKSIDNFLPLLEAVTSSFSTLTATYASTRPTWMNLTAKDDYPPGVSKVRWHSSFQQRAYMLKYFDQLPAFVRLLEMDKASPATTAALKDCLRDSRLHLQLALEQDILEPLVALLHTFERENPDNNPLALRRYNRLKLMLAGPTAPKSVAVHALGGQSINKDGVIRMAQTGKTLVLNYLRSHEEGNAINLNLLQAMEWLDPSTVAHLDPAHLRGVLSNLPFLSMALVDGAVSELGQYKELAAEPFDLAAHGFRAWWLSRGGSIPMWRRVARMLFTCLLSSTPIERIFSLQLAAFNKLSHKAGEKLILTTLREMMLNRGSSVCKMIGGLSTDDADKEAAEFTAEELAELAAAEGLEVLDEEVLDEGGVAE